MILLQVTCVRSQPRANHSRGSSPGHLRLVQGCRWKVGLFWLVCPKKVPCWTSSFFYPQLFTHKNGPYVDLFCLGIIESCFRSVTICRCKEFEIGRKLQNRCSRIEELDANNQKRGITSVQCLDPTSKAAHTHFFFARFHSHFAVESYNLNTFTQGVFNLMASIGFFFRQYA